VSRYLNPLFWHRNLTTFQKLVIANSAVIIVGAVGGPLITLGVRGQLLPVLSIFLLGGLITILVLNFLILRVAFRPLRELEATMAAVQPGVNEPRARANYADPDVRRMATLFNSMLDRLEEERLQITERVMQAQERERQRVARELHDQTGQTLTHEIISLDLLLERTADSETRQQIEAVKRTLEQTLEEVHRMAQDLRPSVLDDLGLVPALRTLARQGAGPEVRVQVEGMHGRLPLPIETALYRIAQEALINAVKYARATRVDIRLEARNGSGVQLSVRDDGVGFDPGRLPARAEPGRAGLGLFGMRERATLLHGTLEVHSRPARGTEIVVHLPLEGFHAA
jgi:two-component system sensor histidine kinase UhpB